MTSIGSITSCRIKTALTTVRGRLNFSGTTSKNPQLGPLPSSPSPAKAKALYLKSKEVSDKYLDPHERILQLNKEIDIVREQAAEKLEKELKKSVWKKLSDPLVKHKHSLYNVFAITLAYVLAHNLFVKSKKEQEARSELTQSQKANADLKHLLESLLQDSTLEEIASAGAAQCSIDRDQNKSKSGLKRLLGTTTVFKQRETDQEVLKGLFAEVLKRELESRIGPFIMSEEDRKQLKIKEIMHQNEENVKVLNENPDLLLQQALESAEKTKGVDGNKQRRIVFSM
eukprot:scaffold1888_cov120-Cylindrotheca_fusiformis.AAC.13